MAWANLRAELDEEFEGLQAFDFRDLDKYTLDRMSTAPEKPAGTKCVVCGIPREALDVRFYVYSETCKRCYQNRWLHEARAANPRVCRCGCGRKLPEGRLTFGHRFATEECRRESDRMKQKEKRRRMTARRAHAA